MDEPDSGPSSLPSLGFWLPMDPTGAHKNPGSWLLDYLDGRPPPRRPLLVTAGSALKASAGLRLGLATATATTCTPQPSPRPAI